METDRQRLSKRVGRSHWAGETIRIAREILIILTQPQVQRYAHQSGLHDIMIAEKEIILTYILQLFAEKGILDKLAFKGGTCLRKLHLGSHGRFSTYLDFTAIEEHDPEDLILEMMTAFEEPFHDVTFEIGDESYYQTQGQQNR